MNIKVCTGCGIEKPATLEFFYKSKTGKYGLSPKCKVCQIEYSVKRYWKNNPVILVYEFPASKVCTKCGIEKPATAEFFHKKEKGKYGLQSWCKVCCTEHYTKPESKKLTNKRRRERRKTDIEYKLSMNLRGRVSKAIKGIAKSESTLKLLGCTVEYLKNHIESQFTDGMNWDNYGKNGWEIDHFIPIKSFDLTDPAQQRECFHWTNLQPLWVKDNRSKGAKVLV